MTPSDLRDLYRHMEWADAEVWRATGTAPAAAADPTLVRLSLHIHTVQRAFLDVWNGTEPAIPDPGAFANLAQIHAWAASYYPSMSQFLDTVTEDTLRRPIVLPWMDEVRQFLGREPETPTLAETIFQVTSHSTHHRAQINARLREIGGEPPIVDYIAWIWFGRPEAVRVQLQGDGG